VPWCDICDRLIDEGELDEGRCPTCESQLEGLPRAPLTWRFRLLIVITIIYLGWRAYQGVTWLMHHG